MESLLLTCGYCGSKLDPSEENLKAGICKCRYCLSTVVIPKNLSQIENWFNRAVELRRNGEFDKAVEAYEKILMEEPADPEAHWGLALSRNGIEYVDDPRSGEKIPTCHRTKAQTILSDPEYLAALRFAEGSAKAVIESEAQRIHEIQKKILEISSKEPPYDVFISYKELDNYGQRTVDSVLAQDIYNGLVKEGYKVFFARKTLEGKLGQEYEPIIYAALNSSKVMVVVGTKPDHFEAVWVRNEWRRFQQMGEITEKTIIPVYRDMLADRLPPELSPYIALDMGKIGFLQDLTDGIGKCLKRNSKSNYRSNGGSSESADGADALNYRAETCLKLKDDSVAKQHFITMTKKFPGDYRGWWGLIRCETDEFKTVRNDRTQLNDYFRKTQILLEENPAMRDQLKQEYIEYLSFVADAMAKKDIEAAKDKRNYYQDEVRAVDQSIRAMEANLEETISRNNMIGASIEEEISANSRSFAKQKEAVEDKTEEKIRQGKKTGIGGLLAVIAGALCFVISANSGWWPGYLLGSLAIVVGAFLAAIYNAMAIISGALLLIGEIILTIQIRGGHSIVVGTVITSLGMLWIVLSVLKKQPDANMWMTSQESKIQKMEQEKEDNSLTLERKKEEHSIAAEQQERELREKIEHAKEKKMINQKQAESYNPFLDLGRERVKEYWLSQLLKEVNIRRAVDKQVETIRQEAHI